MRSFLLSLSIVFVNSLYSQDADPLSSMTYQELNDEFIDLYINGRYEDAIPYAEEMMDYSKRERNDTLLAESMNNLGVLLELLGNYSKAEQLQLESIDIRGRVLGEDHIIYAESLTNLGVLYEEMGLFDEAVSLHLRALGIKKKTSDEDVNYAISLNNLAILYMQTGNYSKALPLFLESKDIRERLLGKEHHQYAISVHNLARLHEIMGNYEEAVVLYSQDLQITKKTIGLSHPEYAISLNNLASVYGKMNEPAKAIPLLLQARDIQEKQLGREHPHYAESINDLAAMFDLQGDGNKALQFYLQSNKILKKTKGIGHPRYNQSLNDLASHYAKVGDIDKAWEMVSLALNSPTGSVVYRTINEAWSHDLLTGSFPSSAHLEQMVESLAVVYVLLEKGREIDDVMAKKMIVANLANGLLSQAKNRVSTEENKLRMLSLSHAWLQRSLQILTPEAEAEQAFRLVDQNKSVLLLEATKSERSYTLGDLPDSLIWQDRQLLKRQSGLQAQLLAGPTEAEREGIINDLNHVNQEIDAFIQMIAREHPKYHKVKYQQEEVDVQEIQSALAPGIALLEYVIGDSTAHVFFMDNQNVQWTRLPIAKEDLRSRIQSLHNSLRDYSADESYQNYTEQAHWFYENLVGAPLRSKKHITNLIIVPDGELGHLPFEAFLVEEAPEQDQGYGDLHYLLNDYSISYSYSAALWKENMEAPAQRNNGQMLAMAPDYGVSLDSTLLAVRLPTDQWRRGELGPLPAARREVETLQEKYAGFFAFDTMASEKVAKEMAADYSVLHFATHGLLDNERPVLSSLAFTEDSDSTESNFWMAHEISKAQLNADLVVLSACETGYGKFERGNGIASLARAFMYAGAPSLVVSLWQVNDVATSELMRNFYDHLDKGLNKDEALRQAKLDYLQSAPELTQHPGFWSPFIMMGKTDAIDIRKKREGMRRGVAIGVLLLVVVGGVVWRRKARN